jgi:hypothetical protein
MASPPVRSVTTPTVTRSSQLTSRGAVVVVGVVVVTGAVVAAEAESVVVGVALVVLADSLPPHAAPSIANAATNTSNSIDFLTEVVLLSHKTSEYIGRCQGTVESHMKPAV